MEYTELVKVPSMKEHGETCSTLAQTLAEKPAIVKSFSEWGVTDGREVNL